MTIRTLEDTIKQVQAIDEVVTAARELKSIYVDPHIGRTVVDKSCIDDLKEKLAALDALTGVSAENGRSQDYEQETAPESLSPSEDGGSVSVGGGEVEPESSDSPSSEPYEFKVGDRVYVSFYDEVGRVVQVADSGDAVLIKLNSSGSTWLDPLFTSIELVTPAADASAEEKKKPKFKVGDKVRIDSSDGVQGFIAEIDFEDFEVVTADGGRYWTSEENLTLVEETTSVNLPAPIQSVLNKITEVFGKKNVDYASDSNWKSNFEGAATNAGIDELAGVRYMIGIKLERLKALAENGRPPSNESVTDSYLDLAVYAVIAAAIATEPQS